MFVSSDECRTGIYQLSSLKNKTVKYIDRQKHNDAIHNSVRVRKCQHEFGPAGRSRGRGRRERICTHIIMAHIIMCARNSAPPCTEVGGAYGGRLASDGVHVTRQTL